MRRASGGESVAGACAGDGAGCPVGADHPASGTGRVRDQSCGATAPATSLSLRSQAPRSRGRTVPGKVPELFELRDRRALNNGFGNALSRAFEIVVTPLLFGLIGWFVDRALGTSPVLTVGLFAFGLVGVAVKLKLGYDREMATHDSSAATAPRQVVPPATRSGASR